MASTRYGRIQHDRHSAINVKFPSPDARKEFADKFNEYHASHDHDGEVPTFEMITAADTKGYTGGRRPVELESISIDGYTHTELIEYHEENGLYTSVFYQPPTCCVAPIISLDREFIVADTLERHELSAIFGDMPADDYQSLLSSVEKDGFMDQHIKILDGKVLDGWHRYRAGRELNLLRKLKFQQWDEKDDGDPQAFVLARNIERRHLDKATRAQIAVTFNERFGFGMNQHSERVNQNDEPKPKTREEIAKEIGVSTATIDRAVIIEKEGESEAVIAGEKTAGEVIKARDAAKLKKRKQQVLKNMWDIHIQAARDYTGDGDTDLNQYLTLPELEMGFIRNHETLAEAFGSGMQRIDNAHNFQDFEDRAFEVDEHGNAKVDVSELEEEYKAIGFYASDISQWERPDWSPDTNWILPLIEAKKVARGHIVPRPEPKPEPDLETLREQVKAEMPKWKQRYKETGKEESELVNRASFSALIHVLRNWENAFGALPEEGAATAEELEEVLKYLKDDSYVFIFRVRRYIGETEGAPDKEGIYKEFKRIFTLHTRFARDIVDCRALGETYHLDEEDVREMMDDFQRELGALEQAIREEIRTDADISAEDIVDRVEVDDVEVVRAMIAKVQLDEAKRPATELPLQDALDEMKERRRMKNEADLEEAMNSLMDAASELNSLLLEDFDFESPADYNSLYDRLCELASVAHKCDKAQLFQLIFEDDFPDAFGIPEMRQWGTILKRILKDVESEADWMLKLRNADDEVSSPDEQIATEDDEDTSLTEIDNLPTVKQFLEDLYLQVETRIDPIQRDNLSIAIHEIFIEQYEGITERQQLAILIDVAHSILVESESTSF